MEDKETKLRRMASWTIAIFAVVFAVFMALFWLIAYPRMGGSRFQALAKALSYGWPIYLVSAMLCLVVYFGYTFYVNRRK